MGILARRPHFRVLYIRVPMQLLKRFTSRFRRSGGIPAKGQAHMTFEDAVRDFPVSDINTRVDNVEYTFWHLL